MHWTNDSHNCERGSKQSGSTAQSKSCTHRRPLETPMIPKKPQRYTNWSAVESEDAATAIKSIKSGACKPCASVHASSKPSLERPSAGFASDSMCSKNTLHLRRANIRCVKDAMKFKSNEVLLPLIRGSQAAWLSMYHRTSLPAMTCGKVWGTMT